MADAGNSVGRRVRVFMDIDIGGWRAAYERARAFVKATNLRYSLSSDELEELGGSEKSRIRKELYPNDFEWSKKGPIVTRMRPERLTIEVWPDVAPLAVKNFLALVTGEKGKGGAGKPLHYKGCPFHRIKAGFIAQCGDILFGNGTGGESIYGKKFKDDAAGLKRKWTKRGLVGMANSGKNSNTSQFFFSFAECAQLNGKHVQFGAIVDGEEVLELIEKAPVVAAENNKPAVPVVVADCGVLAE